MEVTNNPKIVTGKTDELKAKVPPKPISDAYAKTQMSDEVQLSGKGKLLHSLRESYDKLEKGNGKKLDAVQQKLSEGKRLNAEEIVKGILHGTLFEIV